MRRSSFLGVAAERIQCGCWKRTQCLRTARLPQRDLHQAWAAAGMLPAAAAAAAGGPLPTFARLCVRACARMFVCVRVNVSVRACILTHMFV